MDENKSPENNPDTRRLKLELDKLELENKQLEFQLSAKSRRLDLIRTLSGATGFVTGAVALFTIIFSVVKWSGDSEQNRIFKIEERLEKDLSILGDTAFRIRVSGVIALKGFLNKEHSAYHAQVLSALTNMLSIEKECSVRNAINQTLEEVDTNIVSTQLLKQNLISLTGYSRYLVQTGNLRSRVADKYFTPQSTGSEAIARDLSRAMIAILRKGVVVKDLSKTYLVKSDFSNMDLSGCSFEDAVLSWSDFSNCKLRDCNFNRADLEEVNFTNTDLTNARLTATETNDNYKNYIIKQIDEPDYQPAIFSPGFKNANLTNADFSGHILFGIHDVATRDAVMIFNPDFENADLTNANLSNISMYGAVPASGNKLNPFTDDDFFVRSGSCMQWKPYGSLDLASGKSRADYYAVVCTLDSNSVLSPVRGRFSEDLAGIYFNLSKSNWEKAKLSPALSNLLNEQKALKQAAVAGVKKRF